MPYELIPPRLPASPVTFVAGRLILPDHPDLQAALIGGATTYAWVSNWKEGFGMSEDEASMYVKIAALSIRSDSDRVGMVAGFCRRDTPPGWLLCDGSSHETADYPELAAVLPPIMLAETMFRVPDMRNRFLYGAEIADDVGATGGANQVALSTEEMPPHTHRYRTMTGSTWPVVGEGAPLLISNGPFFEINSTATGQGKAHENRPAYFSVRYFIFTGRYRDIEAPAP
ncbi:tail fiber protein [bacterium]|nr:tail fiber protein [bacterium]